MPFLEGARARVPISKDDPRFGRVRARGQDRGAVFLFAALMMVVLVLAAGLVVDVGQQRAAAQAAQADADVIALDMARLADGRTLAQMAGSDYKPLRDAVEASARRNDVPGAAIKDPDPANKGKVLVVDGETTMVEVQWGWFSAVAEPASCGEQTQVGSGVGAPWFAACTDGWHTPNAARVTALDTVDFVFLPIHSDAPRRGGVARQAFARHGSEDLVTFRLGSYLLDASQDGALNDLFGELLGSSVSLQALHYDGLLRHHVTIADIAAFHGITGSPEVVLSQEVTFQQLAQATIDSLRRGGGGVLAEAQIQAIEAVFVGAHAVSSEPIRLGDLVAVDPDEPESALDAKVTALDVLQGGAHLAQCDAGQCHGIVLADFMAGVPGVAVINAPSLTIVEGPRVYVGNQIGGGLQTSQVATTVKLDLGGDEGTVGSCSGLLTCLTSGVLSLLGEIGTISLRHDMTAEVSVDLAGGSASIAALCDDPASRDVDLLAAASLYDVEARVELTFKNQLLLTSSTFKIALVVSNSPPEQPAQPVTFTDPDHMGPVTVGEGTAGLSGLDVSVELNHQHIGGLDALQPLYDVLNATQTMQSIINDYASLLTGAIAQSTDELVGALASRLGINLIGADLDALSIDCGNYGVQLVG